MYYVLSEVSLPTQSFILASSSRLRWLRREEGVSRLECVQLLGPAIYQ